VASVEFGHGYGLRARPAGSTVDGILDDQALGTVADRAPVYLEQVRAKACVVLADPPPAEPAPSPGRLRTKPTEHLGHSYQVTHGRRGNDVFNDEDRPCESVAVTVAVTVPPLSLPCELNGPNWP
jgi:hypothetical protein